VDLFAGIPVSDYAAALTWYERLFGSPPSFFPNDVEAVQELGEHRWMYIEHRPEHAGHAMHTVLVDDLDAHVARVADRGLSPAATETYENGVRKITFRDPDGNEIGFGAAFHRTVSERAPDGDADGLCRADRSRRELEPAVGGAYKSMRITTRRTVGRLTSVKPAAAKMLRLPTWSSPQVISRPGSVSIG